MSQQTRKTNIVKRNYNEMIQNSINSSSNNNELFIKNQLFKSALKFGGPINQDLIIHHNKNVRKSMNYKAPEVTTIFDIDSSIQEQKQKIETNINEINTKSEKNIIKNISNFPKNTKINSEIKNDIRNRTINRNDNNQMHLFNFFSGKKENNNNIFGFYTQQKITNFANILSNEQKDELSNNNNIIEERSLNTNINENNNDIIYNPFLPHKINEKINPFTSNNKSSDNNSSLNDNNNNKKKENENENKNENKNENEIVENPFLAISKNKMKNPFSNMNQLITNIFSNNNNYNNTVINPFNPNNDNIINPFSSSKKNPFSTIPSNNNINNKVEIKNPFIDINNNHNNPFTSNINNSNTNINPFNPFTNNNNNTNNVINPFLSSVNNNNTNTNNNNCINPFINSNNNIFNNNNNQTLNNNDIVNKTDEDEKINVEEEIKIEKDENKLKDFKEVKYEIKNKFYEVQIENLQYLDKENDKKKYISVGAGMLSFQEETNNNGKKVGIFVLRDIFTKNIKIQGIIIDSSSVEKAKLKNGLDFIMIKNILATYSKYDKDNINRETKLTFIRIRVESNNFENLFNKAKEFFEIMKK